MEKPKKRIEIAYYLIQRMSRTEKRHFKLNNQIYKGKDKEFIKLFDFLNNMKVYDIVAIETFCDKELKQKNLSIGYVLNKVIEVVCSVGNHELLTTRNLIQPHINAFHVYYKAQLFEQAYRELDKAELIAEKYEELTILFKIYESKRYVAETTRYDEDICESHTIITKKRFDTLRKIGHRETVLDIGTRLFNAQSDKIEEVYQEILAYRKYYDEFVVLDKIAFNYSCCYYYRGKNARKDAIIVLADTIDVWENNLHLISSQLNSYLTSWIYLLIYGLHPDCIDTVLKYYEIYKQLSQKHKQIFSSLPITLEIMYYTYIHLFKINYILLFDKHNEIEQVTQNTKNMLQKYTNSIFRHESLYNLLLLVSYANFLIKNYTESEYWLNRLEHISHLIFPVLISEEMELLNLLLIYEGNNISLLKSNIRSLNRKWKITPPDSPSVLLVLEVIRKSLLRSNQNKLSQLFEKALEHLLSIEDSATYCIPFSKWIALKMKV